MPCIDSSGEMTEMAVQILAAMAEGAVLNEVAEKTGLPLYRVRSAARDLAEAGLVESSNETFALTENGRAALAKARNSA
jgi:DNA-binding IclR family transcriptional regulator